ncbi:carcinoembryonic antigen-related cell adhesion molecule 3 isoform X2 [Anolis carolinensis]|uniref:carcinoembryonic antigen-related cell adhesion molecule 3 isoform X2 n=1 Tax=Anolis carolinensis TaxID=28377 RepID=UPI002F2B4C96
MSGDPLPPKKRKATTGGCCPTPLGTPRYGTPWPMWVLAGHILLSCCFGSVRAANVSIPVTSEPWLPLQGTEVTIIPSGDLVDVLFCVWFRGFVSNETLIFQYTPPPALKYDYGKAYTGRERMKQHCSLHISNLTMVDIGYYAVQKHRPGNKTSEYGQTFLLVGERPRSKLTGKAIAGIVVGTLLGVMGVAALLVYQTSRANPRT